MNFILKKKVPGGNKGKEGVFKPPHNMKRLRIATTGHGAASWPFFFVLNLPFFDLFAKRAFRITYMQWSLVQDLLSKALVAKNLTQRGGDMLILNSSAGPTAAAEKAPITRTPTHQLAKS